MIQQGELSQILRFVGGHWEGIAGDPDHRTLQGLPNRFWMNSLGGRAGRGYWVTALMYTEDKQFADTFKDVLAKWQSNGLRGAAAAAGGGGGNGGAPPSRAAPPAAAAGPPDLIQIGKKGNR